MNRNNNEDRGSISTIYDDVMAPPPLVYAEPYAGVPSADPEGFVALGRGYVTQYNNNDENQTNYSITALGDPTVVAYQ